LHHWFPPSTVTSKRERAARARTIAPARAVGGPLLNRCRLFRKTVTQTALNPGLAMDSGDAVCGRCGSNALKRSGGA
jgi:hypothetical protein